LIEEQVGAGMRTHADSEGRRRVGSSRAEGEAAERSEVHPTPSVD